MIVEPSENIQTKSYGPALVIERLNALNAHAFASFTYQRYQWHLQALHPVLVPVGAWLDGKPAGLLFMELLLGDRSANILSVFVRKDLRGQGIAKLLLAEAEREARKAGMKQMEITYRSGTPHTPALESLLHGAVWNKPERKHWICTAGLKFQTAPWIEQYKLAKGFTVQPWVDLSEELRAKLRRGEGDWIPEKLNPFECEINLDPICSIALLFDGEPVGWVLAQQRGEDTLIYGSSFVRPDLRGRGHLISAYAEACKRQIYRTKRHIGVWVVPMIYPPMAAFADRRMRPYLDSVEEFMRATKVFEHDSAARSTDLQENAVCQ